MDNPPMTYVRGKGWVYTPPVETLDYTMSCGTRVRVEARIPNIGEHYTCGWTDRWCLAPGVPNITKLLGILGHFEHTSEATQKDIDMYTEMSNTENYKAGWITLVPIE